MNIATKLLKAAAGQAGGAALDVDDVFSTFLYDGTGSTQTITNNIDLSSEGGLVWIKSRSSADNNWLFDTERGTGKALYSNSDQAENTFSTSLTAFNSNGFSLGSIGETNGSGKNLVSWTFRKAPKFFDVVTYTGNFTAGKTVSHNLGSVPGMILIKDTSNTRNWIVYHRSIGEGKFLKLNATDAEASNTYNFNNTAPTSTQFTLGESSNTNTNGATYVAYLFAHNNSDGEFGPDSDQDIIKCGSYIGNSSNTGPIIDLGFEPQWIIIKRVSNTGNWFIIDTMRGFTNGGSDPFLVANATNAEASNTYAQPLSTGFQITKSSSAINYSGDTYIYMAIRRGPLNAPTDATKVFAIDSQGSTGDGNAPSFRSNFPVDMAIRLDTGGASKDISARLTGATRLYTDLTNAESSFSKSKWDYQNGWYSATSTITNYYAHMWKRAPGYFDAVAYTGTGSATTVSHNLGVAPEMMWVKQRSGTKSWYVYHKDTGATKVLVLNTTDVADTYNYYWNDTAPTSSVFTVASNHRVNDSGQTYIAYLFATLPGVSKVGSVSLTGSAINVDCGFSSGARFVLLKRTDSTTAGWWVWDSARGIVSGNDPYLELNTTSAEVTNTDYIDPFASGFTITNSFYSAGTWIFYAIA